MTDGKLVFSTFYSCCKDLGECSKIPLNRKWSVDYLHKTINQSSGLNSIQFKLSICKSFLYGPLYMYQDLFILPQQRKITSEKILDAIKKCIENVK